mmetsp:Transcript_15328/g.43464  ORF Transcript_15328/g.43464 Transcript_15328/m.43464 type:complete len:82 (+) Transcript_15328:303-548(+)
MELLYFVLAMLEGLQRQFLLVGMTSSHLMLYTLFHWILQGGGSVLLKSMPLQSMRYLKILQRLFHIAGPPSHYLDILLGLL